MNNYQITQITYAGHGDTERWIVKARRAPTPAEVRARLSIPPNQGRILVEEINFPTWDLPFPFADEGGKPNRLYEKVRRYLGKHPYDEPSNTSYGDAYFLRSLKEEYGIEAVSIAIQELT